MAEGTRLPDKQLEVARHASQKVTPSHPVKLLSCPKMPRRSWGAPRLSNSFPTNRASVEHRPALAGLGRTLADVDQSCPSFKDSWSKLAADAKETEKLLRRVFPEHGWSTLAASVQRPARRRGVCLEDVGGISFPSPPLSPQCTA